MQKKPVIMKPVLVKAAAVQFRNTGSKNLARARMMVPQINVVAATTTKTIDGYFKQNPQ